MTESLSFAELFEQSLSSKNMVPGSIVRGIVVDIRADVVIVDAGLKSEGVIPLEQFRDDNGQLEVSVGDEVDVALDAVEDGCLSRRAAEILFNRFTTRTRK
ncbi:S1 RNA-binding domain-containing protein [Thioflexithrix psekupsensis]|uniref:S1 motif domain-containing protein n=1 Tax=Thioflexithrix psekupsensis TaxID=1570016 RepID=A0A251X7E2_9GAMM|nr:S1 RNA-binding domain-containing protein [Thioflexithrix psekupsensis]OUD13989.1 hypothetical protein TPSD3_06495 [Thioflexithrix psekupsensis]